MSIDTDTQFEEYRLTSVEASQDGWLCSENSTGIFVPNAQCTQAPAVGEVMRCYGRGFGYPVRGIAINGRVYRYQTPAEQEASHKADVERRSRERVAEYEEKRPDFDARVAALPEPLRLRVERFRSVGGDAWRHEFEPYELFSCEQAAAIAAELKTAEEIRAWATLGYEAQRERVPSLSADHSGNTFGQACALAVPLLQDPASLPRMHGALCPLVGCQDYGCFAAHEARKGIG